MNQQNERIAFIIPARGGSKGIPNKNLRVLGDKSLIGHTLEQAYHSRPRVGRIYVSSDSKAIIKHVNGMLNTYIKGIERPLELAQDNSKVEDVLLHALDLIKPEPTIVIMLQCTSPFREPYDIMNALQQFIDEGADCLFSACKVPGLLWRHYVDGYPEPMYSPKNRPRRQDLAGKWWIENGSIYIFRPEVLRKTGSHVGGEKVSIYPMSWENSLQIDEWEDWILAEKMMRMRNEKVT
jgi:N-acylneuraminate cytidylyltransferase